MTDSTAIVIDDSRVMRRALVPVIEAAGCRVVAEGASGDELLALYEHHRPTLVFLDMIMPGKDGLTAAAELLQKYPRAMVVICTASTARDKIATCLRIGVANYVIKPFDSEKVAQTVRRVLERVHGPQGQTGSATTAS